MGSVWIVVLGPEVKPAETAHLALLDLTPVSFDTMCLRLSSYREGLKEVA